MVVYIPQTMMDKAIELGIDVTGYAVTRPIVSKVIGKNNPTIINDEEDNMFTKDIAVMAAAALCMPTNDLVYPTFSRHPRSNNPTKLLTHKRKAQLKKRAISKANRKRK